MRTQRSEESINHDNRVRQNLEKLAYIYKEGNFVGNQSLAYSVIRDLVEDWV